MSAFGQETWYGSCNHPRTFGTVVGTSALHLLKEILMSILAWIVLGLISGFIASKIVNKSGEGVLLDIILGIVGAVVGGWLFSLVGSRGVNGLNIYSFLVAIVGAVVVLLVYHAIRRA